MKCVLYVCGICDICMWYVCICMWCVCMRYIMHVCE